MFVKYVRPVERPIYFRTTLKQFSSFKATDYTT